MFKRLFKRGLCANATGEKSFPYAETIIHQQHELLYLIKRARFTAFGEHYRFRELLAAADPAKAFRENVPLHTYRDIYLRWWYRPMNGETYVVWPGRIKYFITYGMNGHKIGKIVPFSREMIRTVCKTAIPGLPDSFPPDTYQLPIKLDFNGIFYEGNLAGIVKRHYPVKYKCCFPFNALETLSLQNILMTETGVVAVKTGGNRFRMLTDTGNYFEFIPLDEVDFAKGKPVVEGSKALPLEKIEENTAYLLVCSNRSGAWRYITGEVLLFTHLEKLEFERRDRIVKEQGTA